jgi:ketosteroid isomerase-like protein
MQRRNFLHKLLAATTFGTLGQSANAAVAESAERITEEVTAVLRETERLWAAQDTAEMLKLWDIDNQNPLYLAGEQEDFFIGWEAIRAYLAPANAPKITEAIRVIFSDITVHPIAPDLAFAAYWMRTDMKLVFERKPFGSDNRATALLRKRNDGWKYLTYVESFQSPSVYFRKLYEKDISPDYPEFYEDVTGKSLSDVK